MRRAIEITEDAVALTFDRLAPGMRDIDAAKMMNEEHAKRGIELAAWCNSRVSPRRLTMARRATRSRSSRASTCWECGTRIEDDFMCTANGGELLSRRAPTM